MNGIHPNFCLRLVNCMALLVGAVGCSNQPGALKNPFSAAERVPPPSTRMVAPGTAQPYYQGDPLPVMQSATGAPDSTASVASAIPTTKVNTTAAAMDPATEPNKLASSNEPTIAIPSDGDSLRFERPPPAPESIPNPAAVADAQLPQTLAASAPSEVAHPTATNVVPATHGEPTADVQPVANAIFNGSVNTSSAGPWRAPQIPQPASAPAYAPQSFSPPVAATPIQGSALPTSLPNMDVEMRAVASPEPTQPSVPRIRLPGYPAPQAATDVNFSGATTAGMQVVQVAPGPPQGYFDPTLGAFVYTGPPVGSMLAPTSVASSAGGDGFRPRSSMR